MTAMTTLLRSRGARVARALLTAVALAATVAPAALHAQGLSIGTGPANDASVGVGVGTETGAITTLAQTFITPTACPTTCSP